MRVAVGKWASNELAAGNRILIDSKFASYTHAQYNALDQTSKLGQSKSALAAYELATITANVGRNPRVAQATAVTFAKVNIGIPKEDLRNYVKEITFFVVLKIKDALAYELVPLRFGREENVTEKRDSPDVKIETPTGGVSIGKFYGQEISYKILKPTIVGTGLQASEFGWALSDEMIDMSAKRFIAIIAVPKGTLKLDLEMFVGAKLNSVKALFQDDVASSRHVEFSKVLPK